MDLARADAIATDRLMRPGQGPRLEVAAKARLESPRWRERLLRVQGRPMFGHHPSTLVSGAVHGVNQVVPDSVITAFIGLGLDGLAQNVTEVLTTLVPVLDRAGKGVALSV